MTRNKKEGKMVKQLSRVSALFVLVISGRFSSAMEFEVTKPVASDQAVQAKASLLLGLMCLKGEGCPQDFVKAREQLKNAADQTEDLDVSVCACLEMAKLHLFEKGGVQDRQEMLRYLNKVDNGASQLKGGGEKRVLAAILRDSRVKKSYEYGKLIFWEKSRYFKRETEEIYLEISVKDGLQVVNNGGWSLLHIASDRGYQEIVKLLIRSDAGINARNAEGDTPLHLAVRQGHDTVVELLIDGGAESVALNNAGVAPLKDALCLGEITSVERFLNRGIAVNDRYGQGHTALTLAALYGQREVVALLLGRGADVNLFSDSGETPLHYAMCHGYPEIAVLLIDKGADVNAVNEFKRTPLMELAMTSNIVAKGVTMKRPPSFEREAYNRFLDLEREAIGETKVALARFLIERGAGVAPIDRWDMNALDYAIFRGHPVLAKFLIDNGLSVRTDREKGLTPLHWALDKGDPVLVRLVLAYGAEVNVTNKEGKSISDYACTSKVWKLINAARREATADDATLLSDVEQTEEMRVLLTSKGRIGRAKALFLLGEMYISGNGQKQDYAKANACFTRVASQNYDKEIQARSMIYLAQIYRDGLGAEKDDWKMREQIAKACKIALKLQKLDDLMKQAQFLLKDAPRWGYKELMKVLYARREDAKINGKVALQDQLKEAVRNGEENKIEIMRALGANIDDVEILMVALEAPEELTVMPFLIAQGATVAGIRKSGDTLLHRVTKEHLIPVLLSYGTEMNRADGTGMTPLLAAVDNNRKVMVEELLVHGAEIKAKNYDGKTVLHLVRDVEIAKILIAKGADKNAVDNDGKTPLHRWSPELTQLLIESGADVKAIDKMGRTPLHCAVSLRSISGTKESAERLLNAGAVIDAADNEGVTPLHLAVGVAGKEVVEFLLLRGADFAKADSEGNTALHLAAACGQNSSFGEIDVVKVLVTHGADRKRTNKEGKTPFDLAENSLIKEVLRN